MNRWAGLNAIELNVLEGVFWLHGPSRDALSHRLAFSRTHVNAVIAGMLEQGWLDRSGQRESSGGRRAETLCLHPSLGVLLSADQDQTDMPSTIAVMIVILVLGIAVDAGFGVANQAIRKRWGLS